MRCPYCQQDNDSVRDSRVIEDGRAIRRRRYCNNCRRRFSTIERPSGTFQVIKKSTEREPYSRAKIEKAIELACYKRKISAEQRREMVDAIETELQEENDLEVESRVIGEKCMDQLQKVDQVAYVRFASVYREFKDFKDFVDKLQPILLDRPSRKPEGQS